MLEADFKNLIPVPRLNGKNVNVVAVDLDVHLEPLWDAQTKYLENNNDGDLMWAFMMYGPFATIEDFKAHVIRVMNIPGLHAYVIEYTATTTDPAIVGFVTYMQINPQHRTCEIGHLWLDPRYRRRNIMDEAIYVMLKHAFEGAKYRRVQWTCNNANEPSKKMAQRNQFKFEGVLRNNFIAKGVNRDTAYLSIIDTEWEEAKTAMESKIL